MRPDVSIPTTIKDRWLLAITLIFILAFLHPLSSLVPSARPPALPALTAAKQPADAKKIESALTKLPIYFAPNAGQLDERVKYSASGAGYSFYLTEDGVTYSFTRGAGDEAVEGYALKLSFAGANPGALIEGRKEQAGKVNYLLGNDQNEWQTNVPTFGQVAYKELYPGVDLTYQGAGGKLKYEFIVAPGADPKQIQMAYSGADSLKVDAAGNLVIATPWGTLKDEKPLVYQTIGGKKTEVPAAFAVNRNTVGFTLGGYDKSRPLIIDPGLVYSTFLGGSGQDYGESIALDAGGHAYVTGRTFSTEFPTTVGAYDQSHNGTADAFVTKLNAAGNSLVYSTILGGASMELGYAIAVDAAGNAYVTGATKSTDFPMQGAYSASYNGGDYDAFVTKLNPAGDGLVYSTFLGGESIEFGYSIAVDAAGNAYLTGYTLSSDFPTTIGAFDRTLNGADIFITKLNPTGNALAYSTFLGGSEAGAEAGRSIAVDAAGNAYVIGYTNSSDFPTSEGAYDRTHNGASDSFVTKLNAAGSGLAYSTFLGGSGSETGRAIALDAEGQAYVTGATTSANFPTTDGAYDRTHNGSLDPFITKLSPAGNGLVYSTFLGGIGSDEGLAITVDAAGNAYLIGVTHSLDFPTTADAHDSSHNGGADVFVTKLNLQGSGLAYSTFLGGSGHDYGRGIALDAVGNPHVTGATESSGFPTTAEAFDRTHNGVSDVFVTKLALVHDSTAPTGTVTINQAPYTKSTAVTLNLSAADTGGSGVSHMRFSNDGVFDDTLGAEKWRPYNATQSWTLSSGDGAKKVWAQFKDAAGNQSAVYSATTFLDTVKPSATLSAPAISTNVSKTLSFKVSWTGSDPLPQSGIAAYDVQYKVGPKGTWQTWKTSTTAKSATLKGKAGNTFYFRALAKDNAGNESVWSTTKKTIVPYDNNSLIASRSGFGSTAKSLSSGFYLGTTRYSTKKGHKITYKFTGKSVALIGPKSPKRSEAKIYINGNYVKTVDPYASKLGHRKVLFSKTFKKSGTRTITIENLGTAGRTRFDVDGLGVGR
jgi:hypothetical protein